MIQSMILFFKVNDGVGSVVGGKGGDVVIISRYEVTNPGTTLIFR